MRDTPPPEDRRPGRHALDPVEIRPIYRLGRREAHGIISAYHESFPVEQRIADSTLIGRIDELPGSHANAFYIAERGEAVIGFAYVLFFPSVRVAHLMYLCTARRFRGAGAGCALFERLLWRCRRFDRPPHWITVEAARPEAANTQEQREARASTVRFLEAVGCHRVVADFQAPPLGPGLAIVPFWPMIRPITGAAIDVARVPDILLGLYRLVYGLDHTHPLVRHCLTTFRGEVTPPGQAAAAAP
jgi:hypothetical protein